MKSKKPTNPIFYHNGKDLVNASDEETISFFDIPITLREIYSDLLSNDPFAQYALDDLNYTDPELRLQKFIECTHGNPTKPRQNINRPGTTSFEYFDCGTRSTCRQQGFLCKKFVVPYGVLTQAEVKIVTQVAMDKSDKEIAESLDLSVYTISTHIRNVISKIGARSRVGIAIFAVKRGLI